jgi:hypothetical protein
MSARSDGIEAHDKGDDLWIDNPYKYGEDGYEEWVDGFNYSAACDAELPEI